MLRKITSFILLVLFYACSNEPELQQPSMKEVQEALLEANIKATQIESDQIDAYVQRKKIEVDVTGTGLRYFIYHKGAQHVKADYHKNVVINYTVTLLNGDTCYATNGNPEEFTIGEDNAESGLHEGIQLMYEGDKAILIIPSHLAHGLAGDLKKIPIRSTIIYDVELVKVK